ncbi:unnamed protein product [Adineta steineri]|uniref:EF-hand domain-containing protein n=1 Tax=Adineta steineri TaxID=433720 RepID=A0A814MY14_9BILA|nr:unnamed protein product [Adineta steineri]
MVDAVFNQADLNKDQRLDFNEFRNLIAQSLGAGAGAASYAGSTTAGNGGANQFTTSSTTGGNNQYTTSSYEASGHATFAEGNGTNGSFGSTGAIGASHGNETGNVGCEGSYSSYERSSFTPTSGVDVTGFDANTSAGIGGFDASSASSYGAGGIEASSASAVGYGGGETAGASSSTFETTSSQNQVQVNGGANAQNLYQDPNPQIIRRPAQGGPVTYTQNVKIRFLQPPPIPPPGPLIIKEVRPPQPPPPPPLRVRQQAPPPPQPPPLILREKPPAPPSNTGSQTVLRRLPAIPVPPRSVIIERLPALPPKPRDIIIERWVPYSHTSKRKTIVQRAEAAKDYPKPRNIIIQYEPVQVRVVRQFQRLGVTQESPAAYVQRYGSSLLEAQTLVQQARAAGVVEDISPPKGGPSPTGSSASLNGEYNSAGSTVGATSGVDLTAGGAGYGSAGADFTSAGADFTSAGAEHSTGSVDYSGAAADFSGGEGLDYTTAGGDYATGGEIGTSASPAQSLNRSRSGSQHRNASISGGYGTTQVTGGSHRNSVATGGYDTTHVTGGSSHRNSVANAGYDTTHVSGGSHRNSVATGGYDTTQVTGGSQHRASNFTGFDTTQVTGGSHRNSTVAGGFETAQTSGGSHRASNFTGFDATQASGVEGFPSTYERGTSFASQSGRVQSPGADFVGASASGYESYNGTSGGAHSEDSDPATIAFNEADLNKDGTLDPNEFRQFLSAQFQHRT